jgi:hypothetical protein
MGLSMTAEPTARSVQVPADDVEALEFYAENAGVTFEAMAQLILSQGIEAYTQSQVDNGGRTYFRP